MNLPNEANVALVDFMSAQANYAEKRSALAKAGDPSPTQVAELGMFVRDAEQALIQIFTAVLGSPDESPPEAPEHGGQ